MKIFNAVVFSSLIITASNALAFNCQGSGLIKECESDCKLTETPSSISISESSDNANIISICLFTKCHDVVAQKYPLGSSIFVTWKSSIDQNQHDIPAGSLLIHGKIGSFRTDQLWSKVTCD